MLEMNALHRCDCMEALRDMPDGFFELAIVDPPYGINVNHNMGRRKGEKSSDYDRVTWDAQSPEKDYFNELRRVSKNQIIWGANHFISRIPYDSPCWIVWDKLFSEEVSFAAVEMAWTSFRTVSKRIRLSSVQSERIHPTQKPVALYEYLLRNYAKLGDKILDTHAGSASCAVACIRKGFDWFSCEIHEGYFEKARERITQAYLEREAEFAQTKLEGV